MPEQRLHFRKSLETEAWISEGLKDTWHPVTLLDISVSGAALISNREWDDGSALILRFYLPGNPTQMQLAADVVHCAEHRFLNGYRLGVRFSLLDKEDGALLTQFIDVSLNTVS